VVKSDPFSAFYPDLVEQ